MMDEDDEDYGFEYEGSDNEEDIVDVENDYYNAKSQRDTPDLALASFQKIVDNEASAGEQGEFGFKALKQMTKLTFRLGRYDDALRYYKTLLTYTKKGVTRNVAEKSINGILDYVSAEHGLETGKMQEFYEVTMSALEEAKNERLSTKTNLKLAKLWLDRKEYTRLNKASLYEQGGILKELHASCAPTDDGADVDSSKGTLQLEVYAIEIQMYGEMKNNKKLREIYEKSLRVRSAIPHPRIQGVIRECGGKMYMSERNWSQAQIDFFESFKSYDEAGSPQRIQVLKYLVLAHMLMDSEINPFDSQETKPYKNDPEIMAMTNLVSAYQARDVHEAEKILRSRSRRSQSELLDFDSFLDATDNRSTIMDDPFIRGYIDEVLRSLRTQWILEIIKPYTRIEIAYLARQLSIPSESVEAILVSLILDDKIQGRIDQVTQRLELDRHKAVEVRRYASLERWTTQLVNLQNVMINKSTQIGGPDRQMGGAGPAGGIMGPGSMMSVGASGADMWA
ncbi:BZ3500_MvSof-1268-A1-R1_Chr7-3g09638 [Microbotryum saponariae]|uniref:BZ3500_MvSof-1268-A1-R1_Chr7-3g09638 protein n=1 Tax=Microbotryum saponariae TaxID=289078 RepID=A0A2X0KZH9_9BASI|nr:BZ3501_MvSof-1269-A2-R1_Chr7-2g09361 [Microbotryum saponariae]SDA02324.1 BZ3500_MvSof-1268-A1-R1_Chr7-3g09638 [Microbotryum saponariae]